MNQSHALIITYTLKQMRPLARQNLFVSHNLKPSVQNDATGLACSGTGLVQASSRPWVNISQNSAKAICDALGENYSLITNAQYMSIAREIETNSANWSSQQVHSGELNRGHSDNNPTNSLAISDLNNPCSDTNEICSFSDWNSQRRTHKLSSGEYIWDFAGNVYTWVDWYIGTDRPSQGTTSFIEFNATSATSSMSNEAYKPSNIQLGSAAGIGKYYPGIANGDGAAIRGGRWANGINAGIFNLAFSNEPDTDISASKGFRCTYTP